MGLARIYLVVHFPSDVLAGVIVGIIAGVLGTILSRKLARKILSRKNIFQKKRRWSALFGRLKFKGVEQKAHKRSGAY